ncbi:MAG: sugar transferase [Candidatus Krumholzibacteriota bacterium]|nr:sugar transferase [Candidatus Krumholzibacteriota bacterium]
MRKLSLALDNSDKVRQRTGTFAGDDRLSVRERSALERFVKRMLDFVASAVLLVVGFPFFLAIALLIRLTSSGPVFFRQKRIGEHGEEFTLFKFRTMRTDCDDASHREFARDFILGRMDDSPLDGSETSVYKITNDPRVTAIGSFLRKTSLDELPQFINILRGEMSIVGPRPPLAYEYDCYEDWHKLRLAVRPGLTGLWQVSGRSTVPFHEMVMLDLYYIENWTLLLDLKIMLRTVPVMLTGAGGF